MARHFFMDNSTSEIYFSLGKNGYILFLYRDMLNRLNGEEEVMSLEEEMNRYFGSLPMIAFTDHWRGKTLGIAWYIWQHSLWIQGGIHDHNRRSSY